MVLQQKKPNPLSLKSLVILFFPLGFRRLLSHPYGYSWGHPLFCSVSPPGCGRAPSGEPPPFGISGKIVTVGGGRGGCCRQVPQWMLMFWKKNKKETLCCRDAVRLDVCSPPPQSFQNPLVPIVLYCAPRADRDVNTHQGGHGHGHGLPKPGSCSTSGFGLVPTGGFWTAGDITVL